MKSYKWFLYTIISIVTTCLLISCSKKGDEGAQGPKGDIGASILSGQTDPTSAIGADGDFYLNLQTKVLFGPKTNNNWNIGIDLTGNKGDLGATILSGTTTPNLTLGRIGDFYLDLSKLDLYGPKTEATWGSPMALKTKKPLEKRILVKLNFGYSKNCATCKQYVPANASSSYSIYTASSGEEVINTGDINEYYENGIVIYEASINNGEWFTLDPAFSKPLSNNFKVDNREYYTTFLPNLISYSKTLHQLTVSLNREIRVPQLYSEAQLTNWLDNDMKISIRITLLPRDTVEYLSKMYPNQKIDNEFILKNSKLN